MEKIINLGGERSESVEGTAADAPKIQSTPRLSSTTKAMYIKGGSPRVIQRSSTKFAVRSMIRIEHDDKFYHTRTAVEKQNVQE
eukprot:CAMPEP_0184748286 /NCGR_PEP_ID=MMETSP0315-20130426/17850_1 /TAXON_ID=101924 /ORGANISM="Rhodosorus marinus, Strain UTEX LB 2760" /LENGTH=83 /DNA_ID=CAMNT_0027223171 /DNA_START=94 /DNA_END=345 /DNA_ORIENTATION=+